jgi:hypothetical protein
MADHGTPGRYNAGCRCDVCRAANTARKAKARKAKAGDAPPRESSHGAAGYRRGCRCDVCRAGNTTRMAEGKHDKAYRNRVQQESLERATRRGQGWTPEELETAARADLTAAQVAGMLGRTVGSVHAIRLRLRGQGDS